MHLPQLISDLAVILLTASLVTIVFKRIKQPVVLGYILAGFLIGPYMPYFFSVEDGASLETWSEIGIIVLMFCLGLEFNLHKLVRVGGTAVITALTEVGGMLVVGYLTGRAMGWSGMDCIFLGGMLSMSSTTIIIKAFDELGKTKEHFAQLVFGTLVIEDIVGIFMMIILSTISVSQNISGGDLALKLCLLLLYLALWLIAGIYLLPSILNKAKDFLNDETLLLVSLGICFGMVLLANALGFSSALGAFMSGSLLAGTVHAERVEHLTASIKDLFGSVFFISVGMMIDPAMLKKYILQIIIISVMTVVGKLIFSPLGILLSGHSLKTAVHCGCSLAQIGEFAFIIASLGVSLNAIDDFIYPIIVSVSVITTLTTPFFIKKADGITSLTEKLLPDKLVARLDRLTGEANEDRDTDSDWLAFIKRFVKRTAIYGIIMLGIAIIAIYFVFPMLTSIGIFSELWTKILTLALAYICIALFIRPMMDYRNPLFTTLWIKSSKNRLPLMAINVLRVMIIGLIAWLPLEHAAGVNSILMLPLIAALMFIFAKSDKLASAYINVEARFISNLNERELTAISNDSRSGVAWLDKNLYILKVKCGDDSNGKTLRELDWGRRFGVNVIKIIHENKHINIPRGDVILHRGDDLFCIGEDRSVNNLADAYGVPHEGKIRTLHEFNETEYDPETDFYTFIMQIDSESPFRNVTIAKSGLRDKHDSFILGIQRGNLPIIRPDVNTLIQEGDIVWLIGSHGMATRLLAKDI